MIVHVPLVSGSAVGLLYAFDGRDQAEMLAFSSARYTQLAIEENPETHVVLHKGQEAVYIEK